METKRINKVDWWSENARTNNDAPAGIVEGENAGAVANAVPVEMPQQYVTESQRYPIQSTGPQQLAPVIQPLVIVPYVSKDQPINYLDKAFMTGDFVTTEKEENGKKEYYYEDVYGSDKDAVTSDKGTRKAVKAAKLQSNGPAANGGSIAAFIFGVLYILMLFDWTKILSFLSTFTYNHTAEGVTAYSTAEGFVKSILDGGFAFGWDTTFPTILLLAGIVLTVITIIVSLCTCASRMPVFFKVIAGLAFLLHVVAFLLPTLIFPLINKTEISISFEYYGMYVLMGLCLLIMICVLAARNKKSK